MQFFVKAVPEGSTPILILNNIAPDCAVLINHKKLKLIKKKIDKTNIFATEYWYEIPPKLFNTHIRKSPKGNIYPNNAIAIWALKINKKNKIKKPISKIVFEDPDKIAFGAFSDMRIKELRRYFVPIFCRKNIGFIDFFLYQFQFFMVN